MESRRERLWESISDKFIKFYSQNDRAINLKAMPGHFATSSSHVNYYIDITNLKARAKEAREVAKSMESLLLHHVITVDTIVCMDGTNVVGAYLAEELERGHFSNNNKHETVYVIEPEVNSIGQLMFRESIRMAVEGKNVLVLLATSTTGETLKKSLECIEYYGGNIVGVTAIFGAMDKVDKYEVFPVFTPEDLPSYETYTPSECPYCKKNIPITGIVNGYGMSLL